MYKISSSLQEIFNMAGMQLPDYLKGKELPSLEQTDEEIEHNSKSDEK